MSNYRDKLQSLIESKNGTRDVTQIEYKELSDDLGVSAFTCEGAIGNTALVAGNIKTPAEAEIEIDTFLNMPIKMPL